MDAKVSSLKERTQGNTAPTFFLSTVSVPRKYLAPLPLDPAKLKGLLAGLVPVHVIEQYWNNIIDQGDTTINNDEKTDKPEVMFSQGYDY